MIEFFNTFNSSFYELIDFIVLIFPFVLCLSCVLSLSLFFVKFLRGNKNEK